MDGAASAADGEDSAAVAARHRRRPSRRIPGTYRARLTITPTSGQPTILERSFSVSLKRDPMVVLSECSAQGPEPLSPRRCGGAARVAPTGRGGGHGPAETGRRAARGERVEGQYSPGRARFDDGTREDDAGRGGAGRLAGRGGRGGRGGGGRGARRRLVGVAAPVAPIRRRRDRPPASKNHRRKRRRRRPSGPSNHSSTR